ncbi:MAG: methyltransferase domain-containing protein [Pseudomonadota bacterium]
MARYDRIGLNYTIQRRTDPRLAAALASELKSAQRLLNLGAGTGSYEPKHSELVALEPSREMLQQRPPAAHPAVQGCAETLPFPKASFSHSMTVLSMHHWSNRAQAFSEINRVTRERFVAISWDPSAAPFWLTRDYFPQIIADDVKNFPAITELEQHFDDVRSRPLPIPEDCQDGFLAAFWKRPEAYLSAEIRQSISSFASLPGLEQGLTALRADLEDGSWAERNASLSAATALDAGYCLITAKTRCG